MERGPETTHSRGGTSGDHGKRSVSGRSVHFRTILDSTCCFQGVCLGRYIPVTDLVDAMCASRIKILEETLRDCQDRVNECDETKQALLKQIDDVYEMLDTIDIPPEQRARLRNMVTIPTY